MEDEIIKKIAEKQYDNVAKGISKRISEENLDAEVYSALFGFILCINRITDKKFIEDVKRSIDIMHEEYTTGTKNLRDFVFNKSDDNSESNE